MKPKPTAVPRVDDLLMPRSVANLLIPRSVANLLVRNGIETIMQLITKRPVDLLNLYQFGPRKLAQVQRALDIDGLKLKPNPVVK